MRLYEYEGKALFNNIGIRIPRGAIAKTAAEAEKVALALGCTVIIKAQVLRGGRGKAGLVRFAANPKEAANIAGEILEKIDAGEKLLVEESFTADQEGYIGITVDDVKGVPVVVISSRGGINVEDSAHESMSSMYIDPQTGIYQHQLLTLAKKSGYAGGLAVKIAKLAYELYQVFTRFDCDTAEINPVLINTKTAEVMAGDAKVIVDEYSFGRQPMLTAYRKERNLNETGLFFVDLGGSIGIISGGASGTMMICDSIKAMGGEPANFLDSEGGSTVSAVVERSRFVFDVARNNPRYKVILLNAGLSASPLKGVVEGMCQVIKENPPPVPIVASIRATGAALNEMGLEEGRSILREHGVDVKASLKEAIESAIELAKH